MNKTLKAYVQHLLQRTRTLLFIIVGWHLGKIISRVSGFGNPLTLSYQTVICFIVTFLILGPLFDFYMKQKSNASMHHDPPY